MTTFDTTRWYRGRWGSDYRPLVSSPDSDGHVPAVGRDGRYGLVHLANITLLPLRHTVEWREAKLGDRRISHYGNIMIAGLNDAGHHWVIVEDEVT